MPYYLKSRDKPIPNGGGFYDPATRFRARPYTSFTVQLDQVLAARLANPAACQANKLSTNPDVVADEIDRYMAEICRTNGWNDYITITARGSGGAAVPFYQPEAMLSGREKLASLAGGAALNVEWLSSGAEAIPPEMAEKRATVCAGCPLNGKGGWESYFTVPWSNSVRRALSTRKVWNLATSKDDQLGVCQACLCPLPLKVHVPLPMVLKHITPESEAALHPDCWIRAEQKP